MVLILLRKSEKHVPQGFFGWIQAALKMSDEELLPWVGLDGFIFIQTIKLILALLIMLAVPALLILTPIYYFSVGEDDGQWFLRISIFHISKPRMLWAPLLFNYYMAAVIFYGLHMFYRNLSVYRQAYMQNPSSCVAQVSMRRLSHNIGSLEGAKKLMDLTNRVAVVTNVSSKYSRDDVKKMFDDMGLNDICSVVIVQNRDRVSRMLMKRNSTLEYLEGDFRKLYKQLLLLVAVSDGRRPEEVEDALSQEDRLSAGERKNLMKMLLDIKIFDELRPRHEEKHHEFVDSITFRYGKLIRLDDQLLEAANRFAADNERYILEFDHGRLLDHETVNPELELDPLIAGKSLASWNQIASFKANIKDYGLTVWGTSMSVIIIFGSHRSAVIAEQTLLSGRPFSMEAIAAPTADDLIWPNLYMPEGERFLKRLMGALIYAMINILLMSANSLIIPLLDVTYLEKQIPLLSDIFTMYPKLRAICNGILAPLFYNIFVLLAPYMLYGLSIYQGKISKTAVQESLLQKYIWLLFLQSFVLYLMASTFVIVFVKLITGQYGEIINTLRSNLSNFAALFTNVILQRCAISLMLLLIKPAGLLLQALRAILWKDSIRKRVLYSEPDRVFLGTLYPEYIVFVFMITTSFIPIAPIICLSALLFYSIAYVAFRFHFIFSYEVRQEGGGKYWTHLPAPFITGSITAQFFSMIQFSFVGGTAQALALAPLMIISVASIFFLSGVFERRTSRSALGGEASNRVIQLAEQMGLKQSQTVKIVSVDAGEESCSVEDPLVQDFTAITSRPCDRNYETVPYDFAEIQSRLYVPPDAHMFDEMTAAENPYCNPIMFKRFPNLFLPPTFFHVLREALRIKGYKV
jgi:hypothetical protein